MGFNFVNKFVVAMGFATHAVSCQLVTIWFL